MYVHKVYTGTEWGVFTYHQGVCTKLGTYKTSYTTIRIRIKPPKEETSLLGTAQLNSICPCVCIVQRSHCLCLRLLLILIYSVNRKVWLCICESPTVDVCWWEWSPIVDAWRWGWSPIVDAWRWGWSPIVDAWRWGRSLYKGHGWTSQRGLPPYNGQRDRPRMSFIQKIYCIYFIFVDEM